MILNSSHTAQDDLDRLILIAKRCAHAAPPPEQAVGCMDYSTLWLNRVISVFATMANTTRTEYLQAGLPSKPIAGTSFRTVPINIHTALAEGREGILGLIGTGPFVFTTMTTSFHSLVTEDHTADPTLPRTMQLAHELTDLRRRARRHLAGLTSK